MKKTILAIAGAAMIFGAASCSTNTSSSTTSTNDSLAMVSGILAGKQMQQNIQMSAVQGMAIDKDDFMRGFKEGLNDTTKFSYFAGAITASNMARQNAEQGVDNKVFMEYFKAALDGDTVKITMDDNETMELYRRLSSEAAKAKMEKEFGKNKEEGRKAIEEFAKEEGVIRTESGLAYKVLQEGTGKTPTATDKVKVNYRGTLINGTEFDKNEGIEFGVTQVIAGWTEMLQLMKEGEKVQVYIPQELAYGERQSGPVIEPYSTLIFEMELLEVVPQNEKK